MGDKPAWRGTGAVDFHYSESQEATRKLVRDFATREVAPDAAEQDGTGQFDHLPSET